MSTVASEHTFGTRRGASHSINDAMPKGFCGFRSAEVWSPAVNLYESETTYQVCVDLSGVRKDEIDIEVQGNHLRIRGGRATPKQSHGPAAAGRVRVHLMEIDHGAFARTVELPENVDRDQIAATYLDGILWIDLPKQPRG